MQVKFELIVDVDDGFGFDTPEILQKTLEDTINDAIPDGIYTDFHVIKVIEPKTKAEIEKQKYKDSYYAGQALAIYGQSPELNARVNDLIGSNLPITEEGISKAIVEEQLSRVVIPYDELKQLADDCEVPNDLYVDEKPW